MNNVLFAYIMILIFGIVIGVLIGTILEKRNKKKNLASKFPIDILLGDEVIPNDPKYNNTKMIVTCVWDINYDKPGVISKYMVDCINKKTGRVGSFIWYDVEKTGKHYEIGEIVPSILMERDFTFYDFI